MTWLLVRLLALPALVAQLVVDVASLAGPDDPPADQEPPV